MRHLIVFALALLPLLGVAATRPVNYNDSTGAIIAPSGLTLDWTQKVNGSEASALATDAELSAGLATKVDTVAGKSLSTNDYTDTEKTKLAGVAENANNYVHPATHPASMIEQSGDYRFATDAEKTTWNDKASKLLANKTVYIGVDNKPTMYLDAAAAVDKGGGLVGLPCTGHSFAAGDPIKVIDSTNYNGDYTVDASTTANEIVISATYATETFTASTVSVYYRQSVTSADTQALIDAEPKNLGGYNLAFKFYDGWYAYDSVIAWDCFYGGRLYIQGNDLDTAMEERKRVVLWSSATGAIRFSTNSLYITITKLKCGIDTGASSAAAISTSYSSSGVLVVSCSTVCMSTGSGVYFVYTPSAMVDSCYFSKGSYGIRTRYNSTVYSSANISNPAALPIYGMHASSSIIYKGSTTQPNGTLGAGYNDASGQVLPLKDTDSSIIFGRAHIGYDNVNSDVAVFSHVDAPTGGIGVTADGIAARGKFIIQTSAPASATATGAAGTITWDADYIYICVGANAWKRAALSTW